MRTELQCTGRVQFLFLGSIINIFQIPDGRHLFHQLLIAQNVIFCHR